MGENLARHARQLRAMFGEYRQGRRFNPAQQPEAWQQLSVPSRRAPTDDLFQNRDIVPRPSRFVATTQERRRLQDVASRAALRDPSEIRAWEAFQRLARTFEYPPPVTFRFNDVLGFGGQGLVLKFDEVGSDGQAVRSVAVKKPLTTASHKLLREEEEIMKVGG